MLCNTATTATATVLQTSGDKTGLIPAPKHKVNSRVRESVRAERATAEPTVMFTFSLVDLDGDKSTRPQELLALLAQPVSTVVGSPIPVSTPAPTRVESQRVAAAAFSGSIGQMHR